MTGPWNVITCLSLQTDAFNGGGADPAGVC